MDQAGADMLCPVLALRYAQGAILLTSNRALQEWPTICNQDNTLTAAILDRLLHHAETVIIEGKRFRMQDHIERSTALHEASPESPGRFRRHPGLLCRRPHFHTVDFSPFSRSR